MAKRKDDSQNAKEEVVLTVEYNESATEHDYERFIESLATLLIDAAKNELEASQSG